MDYLNIFMNFIFGGIFVGLFSYISELYSESPHLLKIVAFLWAAPLLFSYLLLIAWKEGDEAAKSFMIHMLIGLAVTLLTVIMTIEIYNWGLYFVVLMNFILLFVTIGLYFKYKIYEMY